MCVLVSGPVLADSLIEGSADAGEAKSLTCRACHGVDGNSVNPVWPSLAGQHATYIFEELQEFKRGDRTDPLMLGQAMMLTEEDMSNLAVYYSELETAIKVVADSATIDRGENLYRGGSRENNTPACIACHGPNLSEDDIVAVSSYVQGLQ